MKPTMHDVAKEAGVSQTTVSLVLNHKSLDKIPKETQERIWKAAHKLNYRVQTFGQSLVTGKTSTIGLLYDETYEYLIHDGFCSSVFNGIQNKVKEENFRLSFATVKNQENILPVMIETHSVDGIIFLSAKSERIIDILQLYSIPTILVDPSKTHSTFTEIKMDNAWGANQAVSYLIGIGHKRIACISAKYENMDFEAASFIERRKGFESTMKNAGLPLDPSLILISEIWYTQRSNDTDPAYRAGYDSMTQLLRLNPPPSAVFVVNDRLALGALAAARDLKIPVPLELSIIGFDDIPESQRSVPPLTTISIPKIELGETAVKHLLHLINTGTPLLTESRIKTNLIVRNSTSPYIPYPSTSILQTKP